MDDETPSETPSPTPHPSAPSGAEESPSREPEDADAVLRQRQVRDKLQQMYGDDSPETVRRFLFELTRESEEPGE